MTSVESKLFIYSSILILLYFGFERYKNSFQSTNILLFLLQLKLEGFFATNESYKIGICQISKIQLYI